MAGQFLLNLFITLLWVLLKDESELYLQTIVSGFIVGAFITLTMRRFFGGQFYLIRVYAILKLIAIFISETLQSIIVVIKHILSPKINIIPVILMLNSNLLLELIVNILSLYAS